MSVFLRLNLAAFFLLGVLPIQAQPASANSVPTVTFNQSWAQGRPWTDYTITVSETGTTHFSGVGNPADGGDNDTFQQDFAMTDANRQRIFDLAKAVNFFDGQFEAKQKNIAQTGSKTLEYRSPNVEHATTYNYSPNPTIQQLTKLFQGIATTVDYGRKLAFQYRFDKLGLDKRLQELTDLQAGGMVEELQAIEPILRKISDDPNLMHIARSEAKQLLRSAGAAGPAPIGQASTQP